MQNMGLLLAVAMVTACGGPQKAEPSHGHMSRSAHLTEAERHERVASGHEAALKRNRERSSPTEMQCIDRSLAGTLTSGGERITVMRPCWTRETDPANVAHKHEAERNRHEAAAHRAKARTLSAAEQRACKGLGIDETSHTPFWHREDVIAVTALKKGTTIVGVRATFRKVSGLTVGWMNRAVACHTARAAAVGFNLKFLSYCPLTLPDTKATVSETAKGIVVTITSNRSEMAAAALGRAQDAIKKNKVKTK